MDGKSDLKERLLSPSVIQSNALTQLEADDDMEEIDEYRLNVSSKQSMTPNSVTSALNHVPKLNIMDSPNSYDSGKSTSSERTDSSQRAIIQVICPGFKIAVRSKPDISSKIRKVLNSEAIIEVFLKTKNGYYELCDHSVSFHVSFFLLF